MGPCSRPADARKLQPTVHLLWPLQTETSPHLSAERIVPEFRMEPKRSSRSFRIPRPAWLLRGPEKPDWNWRGDTRTHRPPRPQVVARCNWARHVSALQFQLQLPPSRRMLKVSPREDSFRTTS